MKLFCKFIVDLLDCIENDKKQFMSFSLYSTAQKSVYSKKVIEV